jgi:bacterial/archaeal transporter family-2 protein
VSAGGFAVFASLAAGVAGAIQVAVNGALGKRIGTLEATGLSLTLSIALMAGVILVTRHGYGGVVAGFREPPWLWLGGVMGVIIVSSITLAGPRIGTFATVGLLMAGQLGMGVVIDALGLFATERVPVSWTRALGLVLLACGAVLAVRR